MLECHYPNLRPDVYHRVHLVMQIKLKEENARNVGGLNSHPVKVTTHQKNSNITGILFEFEFAVLHFSFLLD